MDPQNVNDNPYQVSPESNSERSSHAAFRFLEHGCAAAILFFLFILVWSIAFALSSHTYFAELVEQHRDDSIEALNARVLDYHDHLKIGVVVGAVLTIAQMCAAAYVNEWISYVFAFLHMVLAFVLSIMLLSWWYG